MITGPGFRGRIPRGLTRIRSGYRRVWLVGRTLVRGAADLPAVHRIQDGYRLIPLAAFRRQGLGWRPPRPAHVITQHRVANEPRGIAFFDRLGTALAENPPPARDAPILRALRRIGVGPGLHPSHEHLGTTVLAALRAAGDRVSARVHDPHVDRGAVGARSRRLVRAPLHQRRVRHRLRLPGSRGAVRNRRQPAPGGAVHRRRH